MSLEDELATALGDLRLPSTPGFLWRRGLSLAEATQLFGIPGTSVAIVHDGELAFGGSGVRRAGATEEVDIDTLFQAGSISKPVAALCALRLVAESTIGLNDEVNQHLVSWQIPPNDGWQPRVTVRNLISHTAGLTVHGFPGYARDSEIPSLTMLLDGVAPANTPPVRVASLPGFQFSYSGGGYCVLQQLLMDVSGISFADLARETVLQRLGMVNSSYEQPLREDRWAQAATGHRTAGRPVAGDWHIYPEQAAAGLWTTSMDLVRFIIGIQDAYAGRPGAILPQQLAFEMLSAQATNAQYGLGVYLAGERAGRRFAHGGDDQGFQAAMLGYQERSLGVAIMTNADSGGAILRPIIGALARHFDWPEHPELEPEVVPIDKQAAGAYVGTYHSDAGGRITIRSTAGQLELQVDDQEPVMLRATSAHEWRAPYLNLSVVFATPKDDDKAAGLTLIQDAQYTVPVTALRMGEQAAAGSPSIHPPLTRPD